jgi:hypothetical protein
MLFAQVNAQEREAIRSEMKTTTDAKQYRQLKIIDLSGQSYKVSD